MALYVVVEPEVTGSTYTAPTVNVTDDIGCIVEESLNGLHNGSTNCTSYCCVPAAAVAEGIEVIVTILIMRYKNNHHRGC